MMVAQNLEEVVIELNRIIDLAYEENNRLGFFAALYLRVTAKVKEGIKEDFFDDGARMEILGLTFANRFLHAEALYVKGQKPTKSWLVVFEAAQDPRLLIIQHLFLGMNAHINLDLGIAAAEVSPGDQLKNLKGDFEKINQILNSLIDEVQKEIGQLSPWLAYSDKIFGLVDEKFASFSLKKARNAAWKVANRLSFLAADQKEKEIQRIDKLVAVLARLIMIPSPLLRLVIWFVRLKENKDVRNAILFLR